MTQDQSARGRAASLARWGIGSEGARPLATAIAALIVLVTFATSAASQSLHKDERNGFQFKPPRGFRSIALTPNERILVAKYQDESPIFIGQNGATQFFNSMQLAFYRSGLRDDEDDDRTITERLEEYIESRYGEEAVIKRIKKTKVSRLVACEAEVFDVDAQPETMAYYLLAIDTDDGTYVFRGSTTGKQFSRTKSNFSKAAKSFKAIEKSAGEYSESDLEQMSPQDRFLAEQVAKLPPGWDSMPTDRYLFLYNADKNFVKQMAAQIEGIRNEYEKLYPPDEPIEAISIVRVCDSVEDYYGYGGRAGTGGYWNSGARELVFFDSRPREATLAVLRHEAFHQYIFYFYGELAPHSWYNEGHGDYFAGAQLTGSGRIKKYDKAPAGYDRSGTIREAARLLKEGKSDREGACPKLKELLRFHQSEFYANHRRGVCYAAGWAVVHMLRESRRLSDKVDRILPEYLENLLAARREQATVLRDKFIKEWEGLSENERGNKPSEDVEFYNRLTSTGEVQDRAYELTFEEWTNDDWEDFEEAFIEYVSKI